MHLDFELTRSNDHCGGNGLVFSPGHFFYNSASVKDGLKFMAMFEVFLVLLKVSVRGFT